MTVSKNMTINPVTTTPDMGVFEAFELMKSEGVQRLPVLDGDGNLVGIISEKNITSAAADKEVSIVEFALLLSKIKVGDVMTKEVITVSVDDPVEIHVSVEPSSSMTENGERHDTLFFLLLLIDQKICRDGSTVRYRYYKCSRGHFVPSGLEKLVFYSLRQGPTV